MTNDLPTLAIASAPVPITLRKCQEKTATGNVYLHKDAAKRAASLVRRIAGKSEIRSFRCAHCRLWHIGKRQGDARVVCQRLS